MKNQDLSQFNKGTFEEINSEFIADGLCVMSGLAEWQKKYNSMDTDTAINELRDAIVGRYMGFQLINKDKHGLDCKLNANTNIFLESKVCNNLTKATATFNDTTLEKAEVFKDEKTWLALSMWRSASDLVCICYGQHEGIGEYLEERVRAVANTSSRSTQSISLANLVNKYGFTIVAISMRKEELYTLLTSTYSSLRTMSRDKIIDLSEFTPPYVASKDGE